MNKQTDLRLPVELLNQIWEHIFLEKSISPEDSDNWKTLLTLSLSTRYFRSLALPYLFKSFAPSYQLRGGRPWFSAFCRAWISGDENALVLTHYIRHCTLDVASFSRDIKMPDSSTLLKFTEAYLAALLLLPNLSSLVISATVKVSSLQRLFESKAITSITFIGGVGYTDENPPPDEMGTQRFNEDHFRVLAEIVAAYASDLQNLTLTSSRLSELLLCLQPSFRLTTLHVTSGTLPETEKFRRFLSAMPTLKELSLGYVRSPQDIRLEPGDLPNLESLACRMKRCCPILLSAQVTKLRSLVAEGDLYEGTPLFDDNLTEAFHTMVQTSIGESLRSISIPGDVGAAFCARHTPYLKELTIQLTGNSILLHIEESQDSSLASLVWSWVRFVGYGGCETVDEEDSPSEPKAVMWTHLTSFSFEYTTNWFHEPMDLEFSVDLAEQHRGIGALQARFPNVRTVRFSEFIDWDRRLSGEWVPKVVVAHKQHMINILHAMGDHLAQSGGHWRDMDYSGCLEQLVASEGGL